MMAYIKHWQIMATWLKRNQSQISQSVHPWFLSTILYPHVHFSSSFYVYMSKFFSSSALMLCYQTATLQNISVELGLWFLVNHLCLTAWPSYTSHSVLKQLYRVCVCVHMCVVMQCSKHTELHQSHHILIEAMETDVYL